jgi:dihydroflavonol-4-reductase
MKVLVTGANGHIGANVVRELLEEGHEVRAFVRKTADLRGIEGLDIELVYGDVMSLDTLIPAAQGCERIIHLAAVYKTIASTPEEIVEPAVVGSKNIFEAAKQAGISRIVYTSSVASIGFSDKPEHMRNGDDWNDDAQNPYYVAKTQSEKVAQQLSRDYDIELIVLCPAIVLGAHDYRVTPSNQLVMDWLNGIGQTYRGGLNLVDVRDVAKAHVAALEHGQNRKRYVIGGINREVKDIGKSLKKLTGIKPMHLAMPRSVTLIFASIVEFAAKLLRVRPLFTRDLVYEVIDRYGFYDCSETYKEFNITPRDTEECLMASITWLKDQGRFKPSVLKKLRKNL